LTVLAHLGNTRLIDATTTQGGRMRFIAAAPLALVGSPAFAAAVNSLIFVQNVPALDDVGLVAMSVVVAIAGAIAARRRKDKR